MFQRKREQDRKHIRASQANQYDHNAHAPQAIRDKQSYESKDSDKHASP